MSATVGELVVNLVARTSQFTQGLQRSQQEVGTFAQKATSAAATVGGIARQFLPVVSAAAGVAMAFRGIDRTLRALDDLGDLSAKLGLPAQEIMGLQLAAERAGTSAETLYSAIGRLEKNLGDAASTGKGVTDVLRGLGLNARELAAAGPAEAMAQIAKALGEIDNQAERARVSMALFGKAGLDAAVALKELEEGRRIAKKWDLGSPGAVAAGATYEQITMEAQAAKRSLVEHVVLGWQRIGMLMGGATLADIAATEGAGIPLVRGPRDQRAAHQEWTLSRYAAMDQQRAAAEASLGAQMQRNAEAAAKAAADRQQHIAQLIRQQLTARGGDGAELAPLAISGSLAAYQALARQAMGPTAKKTDEEILKTAREQLAEEKRLNDKVAELVGKITGSETVEIRP